jgi:tricorn protease
VPSRAPLSLFLLSALSATPVVLAQDAPEAAARGRAIRLATSPALSPDGQTLAFEWLGDVWTAPIWGGVAKRATTSSERDGSPAFSPSGAELAYISDAEDRAQAWIAPLAGGPARRVTKHTEGYGLEEWLPQGNGLLLSAARDAFWRDPERFELFELGAKKPAQPLFDDAGSWGRLSPDGKRLLFTREGEPKWRKQYHGSQATQVWLYDLSARRFEKLTKHEHGERYPLWAPDGKHYYVVSQEDGCFNLYRRSLDGAESVQLTRFTDDGPHDPAISRDGGTIVFRRLFDLHRMNTAGGGVPTRIELWDGGAVDIDDLERLALDSASDVAFTADLKQIAFLAGGDVWVMDTELREPVQVTRTAAEERDLIFAPDDQALLCVSDDGGQADLWEIRRKDEKRWWWQSSEFTKKKLTDDADLESGPRFTPDGGSIAFVKGRGDLWLMAADGTNQRRFLESWDRPDFDFSPDGAWIVYAKQDDDFNSDVWLAKLDGSIPAFNLSRHPDNEGSPRWSPDGSKIAFTGRRYDQEVDLFWVYVKRTEEQKSERDRKLEKALEKMKEKGAGSSRGERGSRRPGGEDKPEAPKEKEEPKVEGQEPEKKEPEKPKQEPVVVDLEDIHERIRRVSIPNSSEGGLLWSPDGKTLAFQAKVDAKSGLYTLEWPELGTPKLWAQQGLSRARWVKEGNQLVGLSGGSPATLGKDGKATSYSFRAKMERDRAAYFGEIFDQGWRAMRDGWYDANLGNKDWNAVRAKYGALAREALDGTQLAEVGNMMLGELNGSHLGFSVMLGGGGGGRGRRGGAPGAPVPTPSEPTWRKTTGHLGARFDASFEGPGWRIRDVVKGTPASQEKSRLHAGEIVLEIDGVKLGPDTDPADVLTGDPEREVRLKVKNLRGEEREVALRPTSYGVVRGLLYEQWIETNRALVDRLSGGRLGYLHIRGMDWPSFQRFEAELYAVSYGKDGLLIDVRENGGGSTADHLLTALTQPEHAFTRPRGGTGRGYPQDRRVYATWSKPIAVLCNQNSFSNAEIFPHAIKTLGRGKIIGVPTAGGVVSTGAATLYGGAGMVRMPFRGWFLLKDGEDMELNGCVPDHIVWPAPTEWPRGIDKQVEKAVEVLRAECDAWKARPLPELKKATERKKKG